jgi:alkanesulfonate monooxygenase SsuD/methylene tetrahydromethanopterin reductase-like flavin-dependent oxidoreductase (luciferase family)
MSAWTLQKLSRGRSTLGLGTQVKAHIERRFGLPWSPAGPWIREEVTAVRAVWDCWPASSATATQVSSPTASFSIPVNGPADRVCLRDLARTIQSQGLSRARRAISAG